MDLSDLDKTCVINIITDTRVKFFERTLFQMFFVHVRGKTIYQMHKCYLVFIKLCLSTTFQLDLKGILTEKGASESSAQL